MTLIYLDDVFFHFRKLSLFEYFVSKATLYGQLFMIYDFIFNCRLFEKLVSLSENFEDASKNCDTHNFLISCSISFIDSYLVKFKRASFRQ